MVEALKFWSHVNPLLTCSFGDLILAKLKAFLCAHSVEDLEGNLSLLGSALPLPLVVLSALILQDLDSLFDLVEVPGCVDPEAERFDRLWLSGSIFSPLRGVRDLILRPAIHCSGAENLASVQVVISVPDLDQLLSDIGVIGVGCPPIWRV